MIGDFGFATEITPSQYASSRNLNGGNSFLIEKPNTVGSEEYNAPELFANDNQQHDTAYNGHLYDGAKADIFSAGVTFFLMLTKCPPFRSAHSKDPYFRRLSSPDKKAFWKIFAQLDLNDFARDLFERMTDKDADSRVNLEQIKAHQWMNDTHYDEAGMLKELEIRGEIVQASITAQEARNNSNTQ